MYLLEKTFPACIPTNSGAKSRSGCNLTSLWSYCSNTQRWNVGSLLVKKALIVRASLWKILLCFLLTTSHLQLKSFHKNGLLSLPESYKINYYLRKFAQSWITLLRTCCEAVCLYNGICSILHWPSYGIMCSRKNKNLWAVSLQEDYNVCSLLCILVV